MARPGISLQDLIDRFHLSRDQLGKEVSEEHLREVSRIIDDHEIVGPELGLTEPEMAAVNQDTRTLERQKIAMLMKWKKKSLWKATYRELIEALFKCSRANQAREVCKLLTQCDLSQEVRTREKNVESQIEDEVRKMKEEIENLQKELQRMKRENQKGTRERERMQREIWRMKSEIECLQNELQRMKRENQEMARERDKIQSENEHLQNEREGVINEKIRSLQRTIEINTQLLRERQPTGQEMQGHQCPSGRYPAVTQHCHSVPTSSPPQQQHSWRAALHFGNVRHTRMTNRTFMDDVCKQTWLLAQVIPEYLLSEEGIQINGFIGLPKGSFPQPPPQECFNTAEFLTAQRNLVAGCQYVKRKHGKELDEMCGKLDISDEQLYTNFRTIMSVIWEEPVNFGRMVSLFVVTSVLSARLYREGHQRRISSILGWFEIFLKDHVVPWIREHGGWGGLLYEANVDRLIEDRTMAVADHAATVGLVTLAVLGVSVLAGAIIGR